MQCPRCGSELNPVEYDQVEVETCAKCGGEWLSAGELQQIVEHHEEVFTDQELASIDAVNKEIFTVEKDDHDELKCPECEDVWMEHFNYGDTSGMILHKCTGCNGIWTDKDQLKEAEILVDGWKRCLAKDSSKYQTVLEKIERSEKQELDRSVSISRFGIVNAVLRQFCE
jgi:Zn-finger nucleic acid-binding protein